MSVTAERIKQMFSLERMSGSRLMKKQSQKASEAMEQEQRMLGLAAQCSENDWFRTRVMNWLDQRKAQILHDLSKGDDFSLGLLKGISEAHDHIKNELASAEELRNGR